MQNYIINSLPTYVTSWLNTNVNPVGSAVTIDKTLTIEGSASDAKIVGNKIINISNDLDYIDSIDNVTGELINGYYLNSNGNIYENQDYQVTDFIPVSKGDIIIYDGVYGTTSSGAPTNIPVILYNNNKTKISNLIAPSQTSAGRWYIHEYAIITFDGYIRAESAYNNSSNPNYPKTEVTIRKKVKEKNNLITITSDDMEIGYAIYTQDGHMAKHNSYYYKENIAVYPGNQIVYSGRIGGLNSNAVGIAGYDINKNFVCAVFDNGIAGKTTDAQQIYIDELITIPDNVYFISFCGRIEQPVILELSKNYRNDDDYIIKNNNDYNYFFEECYPITSITGYNLTTAGIYQPVDYTTEVMDENSFYKIPEEATLISIAGDYNTYIRFYDVNLKCLGNGGQATAKTFTVNILAKDNENLQKDAKFVKFGGSSLHLDEIRLTNLIPGKFIKYNKIIEEISNYKIITQKDMTPGIIIYSKGTEA